MSKKALWRFSLTTCPAAEPAFTEVFQNRFGLDCSSYTDLEKGGCIISAYLTKKPADLLAYRTAFLLCFHALQKSGVKLDKPCLKLQKVPAEDWAESWKRHFKPIWIGRKLLIKPGWSRELPQPGQKMVVLDPGLSFGTGQHPTTEFCLKQLVDFHIDAGNQSFLDVGTGSGILAIAAAKLGYKPVVAFDFDPEAVGIAHSNARRNRVLHKIQFSHQDVCKLPMRGAPKYALICANLISTLLISERCRILSRLAPKGVLVVAGILRKEFLQVQEAYENEGMKLIESFVEKEWQSGRFTPVSP